MFSCLPGLSKRIKHLAQGHNIVLLVVEDGNLCQAEQWTLSSPNDTIRLLESNVECSINTEYVFRKMQCNDKIRIISEPR